MVAGICLPPEASPYNSGKEAVIVPGQAQTSAGHFAKAIWALAWEGQACMGHAGAAGIAISKKAARRKDFFIINQFLISTHRGFRSVAKLWKVPLDK